MIDITTTFAVISWKKRRKMLGFTQEELAELMCVTPVQISHYENDKNDIKVSEYSVAAKPSVRKNGNHLSG